MITTKDRAIAPAEQHKLADAIPGAEVQLLADGHVACAKREFGPGPRPGRGLGGGPPGAPGRAASPARPTRWDPSRASASSRSPGSGRARSARWCWPTSGPTSSPSTGPRRCPPNPANARYDILRRGRRAVAVDLKAPGGAEVVLRLVAGADALLEGFRPGVAERLGIGPAACLARNPKARLRAHDRVGTGGPAGRPGRARPHLRGGGRGAGPHRSPRPAARRRRSTWSPTSAGAACSWPWGLLAGLLHAQRTGQGQVVDAAMVDGTALLDGPFYGAAGMGFWSDERGTNLLDSGAPFYDVYRCADGAEMAVGALEPAFFATLLEVLELDPEALPTQARGGALARAARRPRPPAFAARTREEWLARAEGRDACLAPVLTMRRGRRAPPHPGSGHGRRGRRRGTAGAGATLLGHARRPRSPAGGGRASTPTRSCGTSGSPPRRSPACGPTRVVA